jgi:hypothetical protein
MSTLKKEAEQYCKIFKEYDNSRILFKQKLIDYGYKENNHIVLKLLESGISLDKILKTLDTRYEDLCKSSSIAYCLKAGLSVKTIQEISKYSSSRIDLMKNCIIKKIPNEKIDLLKNDKLNH